MPHKHRTNKRKSPKSSHCIRLRMSRTRGGSRQTRQTLQAQHAQSIGRNYSRHNFKTPNTLKLDKKDIIAIPHYDGSMLAEITHVVKNIDGKTALQIVLIAIQCNYSHIEFRLLLVRLKPTYQKLF